MAERRGTRMRGAMASCLLAAAALAVLAGCSSGPDIPRIEEVPPQQGGNGDVLVGEQITVVGRVTGQEVEYGDPEPAATGGGEVVPQYIVVSIRPSDAETEIELVIFNGYVGLPVPDVTQEPLAIPEGEWLFVLRARADGRYDCAPTICVREAP